MRLGHAARLVLRSCLARAVTETEGGAARPAGCGEGTHGDENAKHRSRSPERRSGAPPTEHVSGSLTLRRVSLRVEASSSCSHALNGRCGVVVQDDSLFLRDGRTTPTHHGAACERNASEWLCLPHAGESARQVPPEQTQFQYGPSVALFHESRRFCRRKPGGVVARR